MSEISYFQKYTQQENHITNNTLLMFRHLYRHNPLGFERFLNNMIGDENLEVGLVFRQQVKTKKSTPDGVISQNPFNIYIEAKRNGKLLKDQIRRHLQIAKDKEQGYILGLVQTPLSVTKLEQYKNFCSSEGVAFATTTYTDLVHLLRGQAKDHETELIEIIDDYEQFLLSENMIVKPFRMFCVACGTSFNENVANAIYYEREHRTDNANTRFIGIYRKKTITHIGRIKTSVIAIYKEEELKIEGGGAISDLEKDRIRQTIEASTYYPHLGNERHRYYVIDDLTEVNLKKTSPQGIRSIRYLDLEEDFSASLDINMTMVQIADATRGKTFE